MEKVKGTSEDSFKLLSTYMEMLKKKNPGTRTFLEVNNANNFKYFFMAIRGCIHGFISSIRPVIVIDCTFLKGKFKGTLFIAIALDGTINFILLHLVLVTVRMMHHGGGF